MTQAEWIKEFEALNGRKPSPKELYDAKESGLILPDITSSEKEILYVTKSSKLPWILTAILALVLTLILGVTVGRNGFGQASHQEKISEGTTTRQKQVKKETSETSTEGAKVETKTEATTVATTVATTSASAKPSVSWSSAKSGTLAQAMTYFGNKMSQTGYYKTDTPSTLQGAYAGYAVVESYMYQNGGTTHRYFFTVNPSGSPEVLYSTGGTAVKPTDNAIIPGLFESIYRTGTYHKEPEEQSSNRMRDTHAPAPWSTAQSSQLAAAMVDFGNEMSQPGYYKTTASSLDGAYASYMVLESYMYQKGSTTHRYFFTVSPNGSPEVLYSTGGTSVKPTENAILPDMFASIYNG